jgi:hypothetical protein
MSHDREALFPVPVFVIRPHDCRKTPFFEMRLGKG